MRKIMENLNCVVVVTENYLDIYPQAIGICGRFDL